ncbi:MAG: ferrochelatase [Rickettsiales bacterium]
MNKKTAIILFNLGGPDSLSSVKFFLFNLFYDKNIIRLPNPFRWVIAKIISNRREETAKKIYSLIGGKSPILEETKKQAAALKKELNKDDAKNKYDVFVSMRYWRPFSREVVREISRRNKEFSNLILLPLYPQFSTTTTKSSVEEFKSLAIGTAIENLPTKTICCFYKDADFLKAHAKIIKASIEKAGVDAMILFSAHGLPESIVKDGDPYKWQVENTVKEVVKILKCKNPYKTCYQSKVGPMKWLEPSTEKEIELCAKAKKQVVIVPISFVSEHSETLVELDIEYKEAFHKKGGEGYYRVPALSVEKAFVKSLAGTCKKVSKAFLEGGNQTCSSTLRKECPNKYKGCLCYE